MARSRRAHPTPSRWWGCTLFSPVTLMALLEVIQGPSSSAEAVATAVTLGRRWGKTCILAGTAQASTPAAARPLCAHRSDRGRACVHPQEVDRIGVAAGFPQGPLHVYGSVGGAVVYHAGRSWRADAVSLDPESLKTCSAPATPAPAKPCFYRMPRGLEARPRRARPHRPPDGPTRAEDDVRDMLLLSMVNEAFRCLEEGVLRDLASMDLGAVLGSAPQCWHGPARYISQRGIPRVPRAPGLSSRRPTASPSSSPAASSTGCSPARDGGLI